MDTDLERARLQERLAHYALLATEYPDGPIPEIIRDMDEDLREKIRDLDK
jgi:hypothetical protein